MNVFYDIAVVNRYATADQALEVGPAWQQGNVIDST